MGKQTEMTCDGTDNGDRGFFLNFFGFSIFFQFFPIFFTSLRRPIDE